MRKLRIALFALLYMAPVSAVASGLQPKNLGATLRTITYVIPRLQIVTTGDAGNVTPATRGVVARLRLYSLGVVQPIITQTTTISAMPYPARLTVAGIDGGGNSGALTCTSLTIRGRNQFGEAITETMTSLTETEQLSNLVYEDVTSLVTAGCAIASGGDVNDYLRVAVSSRIGLPVRIRAASDVISACGLDQSASDVAICMKGVGTDPSSRVTLDEAGAIDVARSTIDVLDPQLTDPITLANQDGFVVRIRPAFPLTMP